MSYSRRSVLRDAALLSLAGAASSPLTLLTGCKKEQPVAKPQLTTSTAFSDGVRIFFAGSWLFCRGQGGNGMLAIARDMPSLKHKFPYGQWNESTGIDDNQTDLGSNNLSSSQKPTDLKPYQVTLAGFLASSAAPTLHDLFSAALDHDPFTYLANFSNDILVNLQTPDLRIISLPIPAQIIPAAFRAGALVSHNPNVPLVRIGPYIQTGVATTHIFDYPGATSLTFSQKTVNSTNPGDISIPHAPDSSADFHFHALPAVIDHMDHGVGMFKNIMEIVSSKSAAFKSADLVLDTSVVRPGLSVPTGVTLKELEILTPSSSSRIDLASCSGGSVGVEAIAGANQLADYRLLIDASFDNEPAVISNLLFFFRIAKGFLARLPL